MGHIERIKVKITKTAYWYKEGDVHEVGNYVRFDWGSEDREAPFFEKGSGTYGIDCRHCEILPLDYEIPEYTMEQLFDKVGHKFKISGS